MLFSDVLIHVLCGAVEVGSGVYIPKKRILRLVRSGILLRILINHSEVNSENKEENSWGSEIKGV